MRQIHIRHKRRKRRGDLLPFIIGSVLFHLLLLIFFVVYQLDIAPKVAKEEKKPEFIEITDIPVPKEKETKPPKETKRLAERSHDAPEEKTRDKFTKRAPSVPAQPVPAVPPAPQPKPQVKKEKPVEKKPEKKPEAKVAKREEVKKQVQKDEQLRKDALAALPREELKKETTTKEAARDKTPVKDPSEITREDLFSGVPSTFPQESKNTQDYLGARDVNKKEDTVELSTTEYKYISYFAKLKRQIEGVWGYPQESRMKGEQGQLYLVFTIKRNGELANIELLRSSGYARLDQEAMRAIRAASPFAPFPEAWGSLETLNIKATFIYEFGGFIR